MSDPAGAVSATPDGGFRLGLSNRERKVLLGMARELEELLGTSDPALERLFPDPHPDDAEAGKEYRALVGGDLLNQRRSSIEVLEQTIDEETLTPGQMEAWLLTVNDLRLVLGTKLDVTEDTNDAGLPPGDPRQPTFELYRYLTWLEWQIVEALEP